MIDLLITLGILEIFYNSEDEEDYRVDWQNTAMLVVTAACVVWLVFATVLLVRLLLL